MQSREGLLKRATQRTLNRKTKAGYKKFTWLYRERVCLENRPLMEFRKRALVQKNT